MIERSIEIGREADQIKSVTFKYEEMLAEVDKSPILTAALKFAIRGERADIEIAKILKDIKTAMISAEVKEQGLSREAPAEPDWVKDLRGAARA